MKVVNSITQTDQLLVLLQEIYKEFVFNIDKTHRTSHTLTQNFKCINLDVKLLIKFYITFEKGGIDEKTTLEIKVYVSTESIALRKNRSYFGDCESITVSKTMRDVDQKTGQDSLFNESIRELVVELDKFKVCTECRNLFLEKYPNDMNICIQCVFDTVFYIKDSSCAICNDTIQPKEQIYTLNCCHSFHSQCIMTHFLKTKKRECPLCREIDSR